MSSSGGDSSMDDGDLRKNTAGDGSRIKKSCAKTGGEDDGDLAEWSAFAESFNKVQTVLDRNRELIKQANENHQSRMPENMVKNVAIINELNGNISKVASIYSDLSENFTGNARHRRQTKV